MEEKIKCLATEKVKYTQRVDYIMQLPVPMDAALNKGNLLAQQGLGMNEGWGSEAGPQWEWAC